MASAQKLIFLTFCY